MTIANVNIKKVLFRRGNTIQNDNYVGVFGEVSVDTQANTLRVHDGATAGGTRLATYAELTNVAVGNLDLTGYATDTEITAVNVEIGKLRANITAANVAWAANAAIQATAINTINANIGAFHTYANATFTGGGGSTYSNTNVAAYLTGTISAGNIIPTTNAVFTLGNTTHWWKELYVGSNTIYIGGIPLSIDANQNLLIDGNIVQGGNIDAVNSNVAVIDANIGAYQRWANANAAGQTTSINTISANIGAYQIWANANAAAQTTAINLINANVTAANTAIASVTTAWTANASSQATDINALRANITAANTAIATLQTQVYSNVNTAAYLTGAITAGNLTTGNLTVAYNAVVLGNLRVAGTQTTVNASTLNITDLWVTVADGATQASDAHGAGLRVEGALANIAYSSVSDSFEFNKQIVVGNVKFSDTTRLSGNTITLPNTQGFNWYFNDPMIGSDTVKLYMNELTTGYATWALTTGNGANSWYFDSDAQEFSLFNGGAGGKLVFGTAANAGVHSSIDDIELKSAVGNVYVRANANPWTFSETGNLILPTRMNFMTSPAISGTGIVFGDGTYQYTAWDGVPGNELVNGVHTASLDTTGNLNVPGDILPLVDNLHDLGSATQRFRHLYVGPGTVYVGNAAIKTTVTGNLILPGLTRAIAGTAYAEEVDEEDDQTQTFNSVPTVIDNAHYSYLNGNPDNLSFTPAEYSVDQLDGEGYIDGISIDSPGVGYADQVESLAEQDMWATEVGDPINSFNPGSWVRIPFRVRSRAGESEYEFTQGGGSSDRLVNDDQSVVLDSDGNTTFSGTITMGNGDAVIGQDGDDFVISWDNEALVLRAEQDDVQVQADRSFQIDTNYNGSYKRWVFDTNGYLVHTTGDTQVYSELGNLTLQGGAVGLGSGNVNIVAVETGVAVQTWAFGNDGVLTLPEGGDIVDSNGTSVLGGGSGGGNIAGLTSTVSNQAASHGTTVYSLTLNSDNDENPEIRVYKGTGDDNSAISIGQDNSGFRQANVVAIGNYDVGYNALPGGVYIGYGAGYNNAEQPQGLHSIAIGSKAAWDFTTNNSITLNATGSQLNPDESGLFIKPIREEQYDDLILYYNADSGEVTYSTNTGGGASIGNTAPTSVNGRLWYNTEDGRTYVYALDTWIDASPPAVPGNMVGYDTDGNITLRDDASINYANGVSIINSVYGDAEVAEFLDAYTGNIAKIGSDPLSLTASNIELRSDNETWRFASTGNIVFPDGSEQATAYTGGGGGGSSYGNVELAAYLTDYEGNIYINSESSGLIVDAAGDKRVGFMKYFGIESSFVHANGPTKSVPFQIGRVAADDITRANNSVFTSEIYISNVGQVGINTTTPAYDLDVGGNVGVSGNLFVSNITLSSNLIIQQFPFGDGTTISQANGVVQMAASGTGSTLIGWSEYTDGPGSIAFAAFNETAGNIELTTGNYNTSIYNWIFGADGTITFPDTTVQTTAYTGNINTINGYINFGASPAIGTSGITFADGSHQTTAFTGLASNLRIGRAAPTVSTGGAGDLLGAVAADENYLYYAVDTYGNSSYYTTTATGNNGSVYYHDVVKGDYPRPQIDWTLNIGGAILSPLVSVTDGGTYWRLTTNASTPYSSGQGVTLTGNSGTVWKSVPLTTFQTAVTGTYSNANVVANLQNFVTAISTTANITTTANVIAPNYLFANGVNILSTVSAGSTYSNANVIAMYSANTYVGFGNVGTAYPTQANVTQMFVGNTTTIGAGSNQLGGTYILNNAYFGANGAMYARNTQTGAAQFRVSGGSFDWAGTTGAVTANSVQSFGLWAGLNSSALTTYNSIGITSAGTVAVNGSGGITTTQTVFPLVNATATTVNFGGAATTITAGATTVNVQVGGSTMRGNISAGNIIIGGNISASSIALTSAITAATATATGNVTALNFITTGTYGNITGANVISANSVSVTTFVRTVAVTFAALPDAAAAGAGARAFITDGNTATFGSQVSGGGANAVPVYSNGTNWYVG